MPTSESIETVCNGALDLVGERPLATLTDARKEVRWLVRNYTRYVQASLRQDVWNFSVEPFELSQDASIPAFRWSYSYSLPNGWLRVLPITYRGDRTGVPVLHEVKNNKVYTSQDAPLYAELIMDRQDPGDWDPLFANLMIARLGNGLAYALTHKVSYIQLTKQAVDDAYEVAATANAFEGTPGATEMHDVIRVRSL